VPWLGAPELERAQQKLGMLTHQWQEDRISDGLYFANVEKLEGRIRELTNERNRHAAVAQRAVADVADVCRRWFTPVGDGGLDLSENVPTSAKPFMPSSSALPVKESAVTASSIPTSCSSYGVPDPQHRPGPQVVPPAAVGNLPIFRTRDNSSPSTVHFRDLHRRTDANADELDECRRMRPKMRPP
jgi:hypothetical protein